jgi:hypothetical protein
MPSFAYRLLRMRPCRPRHPLLKLVCGVVGIALLAVLVVIGLFVGLGMLLFAATRRMLRPAAAPAAAPQVIEGEYSVVSPARMSMPVH